MKGDCAVEEAFKEAAAQTVTAQWWYDSRDRNCIRRRRPCRFFENHLAKLRAVRAARPRYTGNEDYV